MTTKGRRAAGRGGQGVNVPKKPKPSAPDPRPPGTLVNRLKPNQTPEEATAELAVAGLAGNTVAIREWSTFPFGDLDATACQNAVVDTVDRVTRGDLEDAEAPLMAQTVTLNALFTNLAHRSATSTYLDHFERFLRLALKAQTQCRAACETLAMIKNPTVFARQANIAHGPQQVNNTVALSRIRRSASATPPGWLGRPARTDQRLDGLDSVGAGRQRFRVCGCVSSGCRGRIRLSVTECIFSRS